MKTASIRYLGDLRTECTHLASGTTIVTDAPVDNHGKGQAFSPTDLVATSLASCVITIIGIYCQSRNIAFNFAEATIEKQMSANPRKIAKIILDLDLSGNNWDELTKKKVLAVAKACPVERTLKGTVALEINII